MSDQKPTAGELTRGTTSGMTGAASSGIAWGDLPGHGVAISPRHTSESLTAPLQFDEKIDLFAARVLGWQIDIADKVRTLEHAGFAVLAILFSYFEMIGQYLPERRNEPFQGGAEAVFDSYLPRDHGRREKALKDLYRDVRNALYHRGLTTGKVLLRPGLARQVIFEPNIEIDPYALPDLVRRHFESYVARLHDPSETSLRQLFERRFDRDNRGLGGDSEG